MQPSHIFSFLKIFFRTEMGSFKIKTRNIQLKVLGSLLCLYLYPYETGKVALFSKQHFMTLHVLIFVNLDRLSMLYVK